MGKEGLLEVVPGIRGRGGAWCGVQIRWSVVSLWQIAGGGISPASNALLL